MSLRTQARLDSQSNITADGDDVKLTAGDSTEYNVKGFITRGDMSIDPQTGAQFHDPKTKITVSLADLDGNEPDDSWLVETTDAEGNAISTYAIDRYFNRTRGLVTIFAEEFE